jgi:hypothetical protein
MNLMVGVRLLFAVLLLVIEPLTMRYVLRERRWALLRSADPAVFVDVWLPISVAERFADLREWPIGMRSSPRLGDGED